MTLAPASMSRMIVEVRSTVSSDGSVNMVVGAARLADEYPANGARDTLNQRFAHTMNERTQTRRIVWTSHPVEVQRSSGDGVG